MSSSRVSPKGIAVVDRTEIDVLNGTSKGFYNVADLNRVEGMTRYIADLLTAYGYPVTITTKTDWVITDFPTATEMGRYLNNVKYCVQQYNSVPGVTLPISMDRLDYIGANNIEKMLVGIEELIEEMISHFRLCNTFKCGEGYND